MGTDERAFDKDSAERPRKPYVPPTIVHLGSVRQLTLGQTGTVGDGASGNFMSNGKSTREAKDDVRYLEEADRRKLADTVLSLKLADYRYKPGAVPNMPSTKRCLGFIIEDVAGDTPFVLKEEKMVDVYAFASAILATVQEQQGTIARLERELAELKSQR